MRTEDKVLDTDLGKELKNELIKLLVEKYDSETHSSDACKILILGTDDICEYSFSENEIKVFNIFHNSFLDLILYWVSMCFLIF